MRLPLRSGLDTAALQPINFSERAPPHGIGTGTQLPLCSPLPLLRQRLGHAPPGLRRSGMFVRFTLVLVGGRLSHGGGVSA